MIRQFSPLNKPTPHPHNYPTTDDYAAINQGQVKTLSVSALAELQSRLPTAVLTTSNAISLQNLIGAWTTNTNSSADPYAVVNQGQLEYLAQQFYNVLSNASYIAGIGLAPSGWTNGAYPWNTNSTAADGYAVANIGQAKYLFSFDLTGSSNQPPAWWEIYYGGSQ